MNFDRVGVIVKEDSKGSVKRSRMIVEDMGLKIIDDRPPLLRRVCHGDPERSLWIGGHPLPLCSRCIFFYPSLFLSIPLGIISIIIFDPPVLTMFIFTIIMLGPLALDGLTQYHGLRSSNNPLRAATGTLAGIGSGIAAPYLAWRFYLILLAG
jgi:uncharacterized membrane protein